MSEAMFLVRDEASVWKRCGGERVLSIRRMKSVAVRVLMLHRGHFLSTDSMPVHVVLLPVAEQRWARMLQIVLNVLRPLCLLSFHEVT